MKKGVLLTTALLLLAAGTAIAHEIRTWTSTTGTTIEARFVKEKSGVIYLETADGASKQIPTAKLSKEDRKLVLKLTDPFAAKKAAQTPDVKKAPDAIYALFGDTLRTASKKKVSVDVLSGKTVGIYFSAHWCGPCRAFTPKLVAFHNEMTRQGKPFEIVFVSSDRDSSAMYSYMNEMDMPWLALEFGSDQKKLLSKKYEVSGIPKLVIIDSKGELVTGNGRGDVSSSEDGSAFDNWN